MSLTRAQSLTSWVLQVIAAAILFQTLFFKFTGAEESRYIFSTIGAEPWGRIASGVVELVASVLLVIPSSAAVGAIIALGTISGALLTHLTILGIEVKGDGGLLFALALIVFVASVGVLYIRRYEIPFVGARVATLEHSVR